MFIKDPLLFTTPISLKEGGRPQVNENKVNLLSEVFVSNKVFVMHLLSPLVTWKSNNMAM